MEAAVKELEIMEGEATEVVMMAKETLSWAEFGWGRTVKRAC